jgi:2-iminoacetate synthase ThiH
VFAIREVNEKYGHIQEVIVQNFRAKPDTEMAWPQIAVLESVTREAGFELRERLATYPEYLADPKWMAGPLRRQALDWTDEAGLVRTQLEAA